MKILAFGEIIWDILPSGEVLGGAPLNFAAHAAIAGAEAYLLSKMPIMPIVYNQNYYVVEKIGGLDFDGYGNPVFTNATLKANVPTAEEAKQKED